MNRKLDTLQEIKPATRTYKKENNLLQYGSILDDLEKLVDFSRAVLYAYNEEENKLTLVDSKRFRHEKDNTVFSEWVLLHKEAIFINDINSTNIISFTGEYPMLSILYVPILFSGKCIGVIGVESVHKNAFSEKQKAILQSYAEVAINIVLDFNINNKLAIKAKQLSILTEIGQVLSSTLDLEELFVKIYEQAGRIMDTDVFFIGLYNDDNAIDFVLLIDENKKYKKEKVTIGDSITSELLQKKRPILINRGIEEFDQLIRQNSVKPFGNTRKLSRSLIVVPIMLRGEIIGAISAQSYRFNAYNQNHLELLQIIANQAATAIENARLYKILKLEKKKLELIINNLKEGIAFIDSQRKIQYANKWLKDRFGEDLEGKECWEALKSLAIPCEKCLFNSKTVTKNKIFELHGKNNKIFKLIQSPTKSPQGELNMLVVIKDITQKKKYDEERIRSERLSAVVKLAGAIAHQLNQPLTGITCYSSLLLEELKEGDKYYEELKEIDMQATRLEELIRKFQNITRFRKKNYLNDQEILDLDKSND